ncbi:MAG: PAS domain S-box protein, partial [Polyangiaceae bacterium]
MRSDDLDEITRLFNHFESIERTLGAALSVAAKTLPLSSAILIEEAPGRSSMICWRTDDESEEAASLAKTHARRAFAYLAGPRPSAAGGERSPSLLPTRVAGEDRHLFVVIPLVVQRSQVFGALQMGSAAALDEADLAFVSNFAAQLALALTRHELRQPVSGAVSIAAREVAFDFAPSPLGATSRQGRPEADAMLASLAAGVVAVDLDGKVTLLNEAAEDLLGWTNLEARGMPIELVVNEFDAEGGACISPCEHLLVHPRDEPERNDRVWFTHRSGARFPVSYTTSALFEGGRHTGALLLFEEISARRGAEEMQRCLAHATAVLAEDLHCATAFRRLAQVAVPLLGDICLVDAVGANDAVSRLGHAHVDTAQEAALDGLLCHATATHTGPIAEAIWRRTSGLFPRIDERWRREMLADPADRRMFGTLDIGSLMIAPITLGERTLGALSFAFVGSSRRHGPAELSLANQLACRAAFALENGRLYEQSQR